MAIYFGRTTARKVYPRKIDKLSVGIELEKEQAMDTMLAIAAYLKSPESEKTQLIITAHKSKEKDNGETPMTFIAGKSKK
jgi:hypothetical protein